MNIKRRGQQTIHASRVDSAPQAQHADSKCGVPGPWVPIVAKVTCAKCKAKKGGKDG